MVEIAWKEAVKQLKSYKPNVGMERSTIRCIVDQYLKAIQVSEEVINEILKADALAAKEGLFEECIFKEIA